MNVRSYYYNMNNEIYNFLNRFGRNQKEQNTVEIFTCGCCYWFAFILATRFPGSTIMYDEVANHFGTKIGSSVYDITGDVTEQYEWIEWSDVTDELHRERIIRDCIMF